MMHSASTTDIPNFFLYSPTESPSHLTDSCFKTPSASFCPLLLALTHDWRVMRKPSGSLKTTTGCKCPITKYSHPSNGGEGQAWPCKRPNLFQTDIPSEVLILTLGGATGSMLHSCFTGSTCTTGMIASRHITNYGTYLHFSS